MRVLTLGTYPLAFPLHGGQRRALAIRDCYVRHNIPYRHIAVYDAAAFPEAERGRDDILLGPVDPRLDPVYATADVRAGLFAAGNDVAFQRILKVARAFSPTHIQLENIYLYPAYRRLLEIPQFSTLRLIYSSHHVASRARREMLKYWSLPEPFVDEISAMVEQWERAAVPAAEFVFASSPEEEQRYLEWGAREIIVAGNGVGHFPIAPLPADAAHKLGGERFLLMVGSDQPHNITGVLRLLADPAMNFLPARPVLVVCGTVVAGLARHPEFQKARDKGDRRIVVATDANDRFLGSLKTACHGFVLPVLSGSGARVKTAEALLSGKHVVATPLALRGYEDYMQAPGVVIAEDARAFRTAMIDVLGAPPLEISEAERSRRQQLHWPATLKPVIERITRGDNDNLAPSADVPGQDSLVAERSNIAHFVAARRPWAVHASYEEQIIEVARRVLHRESNSLETGALRGTILQSLLRFAPRGIHYSFEPLPEMYATLKRSFGHLSNVHLHDIAPTAAAGGIPLRQMAARSARVAGEGFQPRADLAGPSEVRADALDNVIPTGAGIDLVILGIAGMELDTIRGGLQILRRFRPVIVFRALSLIGGTPAIGGTPSPASVSTMDGHHLEELHSLLTGECDLGIRLLTEWLKDPEVLELDRDAFLAAAGSSGDVHFIATV